MVHSYHYSSTDCSQIFDSYQNENISLNFMRELCDEVDDIVARDQYSQPMVWIGIYIAMASFVCMAAMVADLLHGFRNRKTWFPCKYFSLNAASITVIAVAMKLPVDLSSPMPGAVDQVTKLGSMAFMCTMMANLMPSLASMDNKSLLANVTGLAILVITMIVNICIQINTDLISHENSFDDSNSVSDIKFHFVKVACTYVALILLLLIVLISSAISIPAFKQILEQKYRDIKTMTLDDDQQPQYTTPEKLRQHVRRHWVMVKTSSPQFVMANNPLSFASGVICVIAIVINTSLLLRILESEVYVAFRSDYKLSMLAIYITQFIGCVVGGITPVFRCFTILSFKMFTESNRNYLMDFTVEKHWTEKLCELKESHIPFLSSRSRTRTLVRRSKTITMSLLIVFQKIIVVSSKMARLISAVVLIFAAYCFFCWNSLKEVFTTPIASESDDDTNKKDLDTYVLQLEDEIRLSDKTLQGISKSMDHLVHKVEKEEHNNLLKLLDKSTGFKGVANFDTDQVQPLLAVVPPNNWSLPIVTLTCIATALPNIEKNTVNRLFKSVGEGLLYTHLVEESLNGAGENVINQKAAASLWHEVEGKRKWLDNNLERSAYYRKTSREIVQWFSDKAKEIVIDIVSKSTDGKPEKSFSNKLLAANSMYRISQTTLLNYGSSIDPIAEEELFNKLNGMIADIMVACFTNIPQVIKMKCHENVIEKREASVEAAAMLLGRTTHIMNKLALHELPGMDPDKMAFIDEWRLHMKQSIP